MSDVPIRSRIYASMLVATVIAVVGIAWRNHDSSWSTNQVRTAILLAVVIIIVEKFEIDFPHASFQFSISVGAILALAAGLTLGPLLGALVVITAELVTDLLDRLRPIQIIVNPSNLGLATFCGAAVYQWLGPGSAENTTPLDKPSYMVATVLAAVVYTLVNTWVLAFIVAPVVGDSPYHMWRSNLSATYMLLILPTLGSLVPVIAERNPLGILVLFVPLVGSHLAQRALRKVEEQTQATMNELVDVVDRRDPYTHSHSIRVADYVRSILEELPHVPALTRQVIIDAARIHDLGKVGTPDKSLSKSGPLTEEERREIQQHAAIGADIVGKLEFYKRIASLVRSHHERWDGLGYPDGLKGEEIPLGARIIGVADAFDAMTTDRPYRRALSVETAMAELKKNSGTQFDPQIVEAFERATMRPFPELNPMPAPSPAG